MPFAEINDNKLYFEDTGGDGPAVIFSHGFTLSHAMWDGVTSILADDYRCISWDSRGHGMSTIAGPHTEWDLADDVAGLLDHLGIEKAAAVGLSQGGFVTFRFGIRYGDRISAAVFMDTSPIRVEPMGPHREMADNWVSGGPIGELIEQFAPFQFGPDYDASTWIQAWQSRSPEEWKVPWDSILQQDTVIDQLGAITCPSLVVHGVVDMAYPYPEVPQVTVDALPDCRGLVGIEGAAHVPAVTHPTEVADALGKFFGEVLE